MTYEDRDNILRTLNNTAIAKKLILEKGDPAEILRHINYALSWAYPLLGVDHPMYKIDQAAPYEPLNHEDIQLPPAAQAAKLRLPQQSALKEFIALMKAAYTCK